MSDEDSFGGDEKLIQRGKFIFYEYFPISKLIGSKRAIQRSKSWRIFSIYWFEENL
jgi:hypothetical protein